MPRERTNENVFQASVRRLEEMYAEGHRIVVTTSGGKDSAIMLECAIIAARRTNRLPVDVLTRDEEANWPDSYEYLERVAERPEVAMRWLVAHQPIINIYNREMPYWWVFDPQVDPSIWVRPYPKYGEEITEINIKSVNTRERFPPAPGKESFTAIGIRGEESPTRRRAIFSMGGSVSSRRTNGEERVMWPIYDWTEKDVWYAIREFGWDYAHCYDTIARLGVRGGDLRLASPTMSGAQIPALQAAARAWPEWFERVCNRLPGTRLGAQFGRAAIQPKRRIGETWEQTFWRECVETAPKWIADRSIEVHRRKTHRHAGHSTTPFPQTDGCQRCGPNANSYRSLANGLYLGDPFGMRGADELECVEPEFFRPGAGTWGGKPGF